MITNKAQLVGTLDQIAWAANALEGLRRDVNEENAIVFPVVAEAYLHHILGMTSEARAYVQSLPEMAQRNGNGSVSSIAESAISDKIAA